MKKIPPSPASRLKDYNYIKKDEHVMDIKSPLLTVDAVIIIDGKFVVIQRKNEPFKGKWALPGGFVDRGERVEDAARREVKEETGLDVELIALLGVYSDPARDPRGHTVSVVYLAKPIGGVLNAGDDAADAKLVCPEDDPELAFDHAVIMNDALEAAKRLKFID
jgi:8-oxo-dGTP diphosphatase